MMTSRSRGFTLVEMLVAVTLVAALATITTAGVQHARHKAALATEINAARNLSIAYASYAAEHSGRLLPGYQSDPAASNLHGERLHHPVNARYPWRLAPYAPKVEGILLFNGNEKFLDADNSDYLVSVRPNLGINSIFVGGHHGSGSPLRPSPRMIEALGKFHVTRMAEAFAAEKLIVFASARSGPREAGNFEIRPPNTLAPEWSDKPFAKSTSPGDHGFVDFRWSGKAVVATLGGGVVMLDEDQMRDMRRWSNQAARRNDRDFVVAP